MSRKNEYLRTHIDIAKELPHPDERWRASSTDFDSGEIQKLSKGTMIETCDDRSQSSKNRVWKTNEESYNYAQNAIAESNERRAQKNGRAQCPFCGCFGFSNVGGGKLLCRECDRESLKREWMTKMTDGGDG